MFSILYAAHKCIFLVVDCMKSIIWNISVCSVAFFRHIENSLVSYAARCNNASILIYWKYAEIVIRRNVKVDWLADNWLVCAEPCLISAYMSELKWIAHRFVRPTSRMYALCLFIDPQYRANDVLKKCFGIMLSLRSTLIPFMKHINQIP